MRKLVQLTDKNSLFIQVKLKDGHTILYTGSRKKIADDIGADCPMFDETLVSMVKHEFKGAEVKQIDSKEAVMLMKRVSDSNSKIVVY